MLPLQHLKDVKRAVAVILCVDLDIEMQSSYPKESIMSRKRIITLFLFWLPQLSKNNSNFRNLMFLTVWLRIATLFIDPKKGSRGNDVRPLFPFKFIPSMNWTDVIRSTKNTQAINIGGRQVIGRSGMFTYEFWQKDIMAHVHGHYNILCGGAWLLFLCMDYLIYESLPQTICLYYFQMLWKYVPLCFSDDIGVVSISINIIIIIIIIINKIIWNSYDYFLRLL